MSCHVTGFSKYSVAAASRYCVSSSEILMPCGSPVEIEVGGADQRVVALIRDGEDDAAILVLEEISAVVVEEFAHHDVTAFDQADMMRLVLPKALAQHGIDPRAGSVDQDAGFHSAAQLAVEVLQLDGPQTIFAGGRDHLGAGLDHRALVGGVAGGERHEARIVHPAVGIFEGAGVAALQRPADRIAAEVERLGRPAAAYGRRDDRRRTGRGEGARRDADPCDAAARSAEAR